MLRDLFWLRDPKGSFFSKPAIMFSTVDFPQPLGPRRQVIVLLSHSKEKSTVTEGQLL
jgi:hypothetical protein